jgi:hypothetical protein
MLTMRSRCSMYSPVWPWSLVGDHAAVGVIYYSADMSLGAQMKFLGGHTPNQSFGDFLHVVEERQIMLEKVRCDSS